MRETLEAAARELGLDLSDGQLDQLLAYLAQLVTIFNTHVHPGELALGIFPVTPAPPVAPMPPPSPSLLSIKVLLE